MGPLILLGALLAVMWAVMIRPQRRRQAEQKKVLETIAPGDEVLTVGGIFGIVHETDEDDNLIVEIAEGIRVRVARRAVAAVVKDEDGDEDEADETDDDEVIDGEATEVDAADSHDESQTSA